MKSINITGLFLSVAILGALHFLNPADLPFSVSESLAQIPAPSTFLLIAVILAASGFVSGLTGFGFSAIGILVIWVLPPVQAVPLLMGLSLLNQIYSYLQVSAQASSQVKSTSSKLDCVKAHPAKSLIFGGVAGIPVGLWLLHNLPAQVLTLMVGGVLCAYALWSLFKPAITLKGFESPAHKAIVGSLGGMIGGFTAFPGSAVVVWSSLKGFSKEKQRHMVQPYIMAMQLVSLIVLTISTDAISGQTLWMLCLLCPAVLPATSMGVQVFKKMSERNFKNAVMALLMISGGSMVAKVLIPMLLMSSSFFLT